MANERQNQWMQEALDETLPPDELRARLDESPEAAAAYERQRRVDQVLRGTPLERAPHTLAVRIVARLAETIAQRTGRRGGAALALALALLAALLLPLLIGFGWLIITLISQPAALGQALAALAALLAGALALVEGMVASAGRFIETYPEAPIAALAIIPISVAWLVRTARKHRAGEKQRRAEARLADTTAPAAGGTRRSADVRTTEQRSERRMGGKDEP